MQATVFTADITEIREREPRAPHSSSFRMSDRRNLRGQCSRDGRRKGRGSILAVSLVDLGAHLFEALAFVDHLHHVTRDAYADVSGEAHSIED